MARDLDLNITGNARRAQQALNDVATGSERAARITDQLSRSFDHLENEANDAQRALDRVQREIADNGPTAELNAELAELQHRLSEIADERRLGENLRAQFRRSTTAAQQLDHQLADVRRELDRLNDEYSRGGDPAVLRRIQEQQRELQRLAGIRRRIAAEDEENQARLARMAEEALRAQRRREDEERRRSEDEDNRSFLRRLARRTRAAGDGLQGAPVPPGFIAAGAAIGASAAVPLLAAIGGALTGLAGAGVAGAGVAGAIMGDPERFKQEWSVAADSVKTEFLDATKIFTGPTLEAIRGIGPLVESWNLDETFASAARYVRPLVAGVEGFATGVIRGVSAMVEKGEPTVEALASGLAELGDAAGDAFESIADGAEGGGEALRDVLFFTADVIRGFGEITQAAEDAYSFIHDHPILSAISSGGLSLPITLLDQFSDSAGQVSGVLADVGSSGATAFYGLDQAERDALSTVERLNDEYDRTRSNLLGVSNAAIAVEQDFDDLAEAFKKNGDTLDITTQKGRDNLEVINQTVSDLMRQRDAAIAAGGGTQAAYDQANAAFNAQLANLERLLVKLGLSAAAAHNLMNSFYSKTVDVTVRVRQVGNVSVDGVISSGDQRRNAGGAYASGGPVSETGWALVGENGPELRFLNRGDYIMDAQKTARALNGGTGSTMAGGGGGGGLTLRFGGNLDSWMARGFMAAIDSGQVQIFDSTGQPVTVR
jgi:hypothetical protein